MFYPSQHPHYSMGSSPLPAATTSSSASTSSKKGRKGYCQVGCYHHARRSYSPAKCHWSPRRGIQSISNIRLRYFVSLLLVLLVLVVVVKGSQLSSSSLPRSEEQKVQGVTSHVKAMRTERLAKAEAQRVRIPIEVVESCMERGVEREASLPLHESMDVMRSTLQDDWNEERAAAYLVATRYEGSSKAARLLRNEFGASHVRTLSSNRHAGWSCFIVHAGLADGSRLLAAPGLYGSSYSEPVPHGLKLASSLLLDTSSDWRGLVLHMAPFTSTENFLLRWKEGLTEGASRMQDGQHHWLRATHSAEQAAMWEETATEHLDGGASSPLLDCGWDGAELIPMGKATAPTILVVNLPRVLHPHARDPEHPDADIEGRACLMGMLSFLTAQADVSHISHRSVNKLHNYVATGMTQSGRPGGAGSTPLWDAGLDGSGEVVGIIDTGLDDASCFFHDPNRNAVSRTSLQSISDPQTDMSLRKVVQYVAYMDGTDQFEGHGTHVAGAVAGVTYQGWTEQTCGGGEVRSCWGACMSDADCQASQWSPPGASTCADLYSGHPAWNFYCPAYDCAGFGTDASLCGTDAVQTVTEATGSAPGAKIAFFDAQLSSSEDLITPDNLALAFGPAYTGAGARVSSNSWGGATLCFYDTLCATVDEYIVDHPDYLAVFSAGNSGDQGSCSIAVPAVAKNILSVGASTSGKSRGFKVDPNVEDLDSVAWFSSRGPTIDGRTKPDVLAPGYYIWSASASSSSVIDDETCAITALSGTSMSAPIVAGAAAQVRQYYRSGFYADDVTTAGLCANGLYRCDPISFPTAALMKATIINAALDMPSGLATPNNAEGFGRVTLNSTLPLGSADLSLWAYEGTLSANEQLVFDVQVSSTAQPLSATLVWTDPVLAPGAAYQVAHDLDIVLLGADCSPIYANGGDGLEFWNNVERIVVPAAQLEASFTLKIMAAELTETDTQAFAIVLSMGAGGVVEAGNATTCQDASFAELEEPPVAECSAVPGYPDCCVPTSKFVDFIGDGWCDERLGYSFLNTEECGWDGGDCCPWTCKAETEYCSVVGYTCRDPDWLACNEVPLHYVGDGMCDSDGPNLNTAECGFDLGDCCESCCNPILVATLSSTDAAEFDWGVGAHPPHQYNCGEGGYFCADPEGADGSCISDASRTSTGGALPLLIFSLLLLVLAPDVLKIM
jgi:subtilisin family serine protease